MGKADVQTLDYFQDSRVFADMINAYFFGGKQIIKPEELEEGDKELVYAQTDQVNRVLRDSVKKYFKEMLLCIFVLEHQKNVDYHMVIRRMLAEAMEYHQQWRRLQKRHREKFMNCWTWSVCRK